MTKRCAICGTNLEDDLFAAVTRKPCCSICVTLHIGGAPMTADLILRVRERLGLEPGEYLEQDNADAASRILGR